MSQAMLELLFKALGETLTMVLVSGAIGLALGIPLGVVLFISKPGQIKEHALLNKALGTVVNIGRSIPFIILIVSIIPLTRLLVGTSIGTMAAVVPLAIGATPFIARLV